VAVSRSLQTLEGQVGHEVVAARSVWPLIAGGLPARASAASASLAAASGAAASINQPPLFDEAQAASLTGPASQLAGEFRTFDGLARRGWQLLGAASQQIAHGTPVAARFARQNEGLYIESVYDANFTLAQIGRQLALAYTKLGGPQAFGSSLSQAEVDALAKAYSEASDRLHPHPGVSFGS
jgi:hypothetical protein